MANDRMYIRCTVCGKSMVIAKHFSDPWYTPEWSDGVNLGDLLDEFFIDHYQCIPEEVHGDVLFCMKLGMHYELKYEMEDDFEDWGRDAVSWEEIRENIKKRKKKTGLGEGE